MESLNQELETLSDERREERGAARTDPAIATELEPLNPPVPKETTNAKRATGRRWWQEVAIAIGNHNYEEIKERSKKKEMEQQKLLADIQKILADRNKDRLEIASGRGDGVRCWI